MKNIINTLVLLLFFISLNVLSANEIKEEQMEEKIEANNALKTKVSSLNRDVDLLSIKQQKLSDAIEKSRTVQTDINLTASSLVAYIEDAYTTEKPIPIKINQKTNWYIYLLPLITIITIIASTLLSLRTIKIKSHESISALKASNKNLVEINNKSISEEHDRTQKTIIANNRQEWINSLRDEITSFLAVVASTSPSQHLTQMNEAEKKNLWLHSYKIELLINPKEKDHVDLVDKIREEINNLINLKEETLISDIISISQKILKREWDRVRTFEKAS
ncbi:hypothetical protein HH219_21575 [Pseudoalteromonas sp. NEC-BIFX-2020_015]|uniref:hypothetical protein n=1 Tax=Pseudoalteromonas sp. NEC-BIFX-2020_015 TaxID=2729544 RepID=UPI0014616C41|nr:hypothetical protein [Pseudoalteromonas sp. NEC-BIFX-2020_015]NMR28071.1 hypothetical protein [Pseudoalteromonas sp. NEC-BIFX-2020_015]